MERIKIIEKTLEYKISEVAVVEDSQKEEYNGCVYFNGICIKYVPFHPSKKYVERRCKELIDGWKNTSKRGKATHLYCVTGRFYEFK